MFENVDEWMYQEEYEKIDMFLENIKIETTPITILIGVLVITLRLREISFSRKIFCKSLREFLIKTEPLRVDSLLHGLE